MKYKKKKLNKAKVLFVLCIGMFLFFSARFVYQNFNEIIDLMHIFFKDNTTDEYSIIKEDNNDNYLGKGQETVDNQDGYFTTFTTINNKTFNEYKQNEGSWKNHQYWNDNMEESGCGITAMSVILSGYGINNTPDDLRNKYYPVLNGENMSKELKGYGIVTENDFETIANKAMSVVEWKYVPSTPTKEKFIQAMKDVNIIGRLFKLTNK